MPLSALVHEVLYKNIFNTVKMPGFGLSGAEPGLTLGSDRAPRGRREPLALAVCHFLTADTVHCKRPSLQPFPSGKGPETFPTGHCRLPGGDKGRNGWGYPAVGYRPLDGRAGSLRGSVPAGSTAPLGPFWASSLF